MWASAIFLFYIFPLVTCYHDNIQDQLEDDFDDDFQEEETMRDEFEDDRRRHRDFKHLHRDERIKNYDEDFRKNIPFHKREDEEERYFRSRFHRKRSNEPIAITTLQDDALASHNAARIRHVNTPEVTYNSLLEEHARAYAVHLARTNTFKHDEGELTRYAEGENLYKSFTDNIQDGMCAALFKWYNEILIFDWNKLPTVYNFMLPGDVGHFTQVVWASSTQIGCAGAYKRSNDPRGNYILYIVCRYKQAGNRQGQFPQQVHALKSASFSSGFTKYDDVCGASCKDNSKDCNVGKCESQFFKDIMEKDCRKTCGKC